MKLLGARRSSAGFVSLGLAVVVICALLAAVTGSPVHDGVVNLLNGRAWLANDTQGVVLLANGSTAKVDLRLKVAGAAGHKLQVLNVGKDSLLYDATSGGLSSLSAADLKVSGARQVGDPLSIDLVADGDKLIVVDKAKGFVTAEDPLTGHVLGSVQVGANLTRAVVDDTGKVWVVDRRVGEVIPVTLDTLGTHLTPGTPVRVDADGGLDLSLVNGKPVVVEPAKSSLVTIDGDHVGTRTQLTLHPGEMPAVSRVVTGDIVPVSVNTSGVVVLERGATESRVDLQRQGHNLGEPVAFNGNVYVPDYTTGELLILDGQGRQSAPPLSVAKGRFDVRIQGDRLWVDDPENGGDAFVMDKGAPFRRIDKGKPDPPTVVTTTPTTPITVPHVTTVPTTVAGGTGNGGGKGTTTTTAITIAPSPPSAPSAVSALAGNASATIVWGAANPHGSSISGYTLKWRATGGGQPGQQSVPPAQLQAVVSSLANGDTYIFTVSATNAVGVGPGVDFTPLSPIADLPSSPQNVRASNLKGDGSIDVSWDKVVGQGLTIDHYAVTSHTGSVAQLVHADVKGTTVNLAAANGMVLGIQYTFTVTATATNNLSAGSQPSVETRPSVTPYKPAEIPAGLAAATNGTGALTISWTKPTPTALNGGLLANYLVTSDRGVTAPPPVTGTTASFDKLANGTTYTFTVVVQTTVDGRTIPGRPGGTISGTPRTVPTVSAFTASQSGYTTLNFNVTASANGSGPMTCHVFVGGAERWTGACGDGAAVGGSIGSLTPGTSYPVHATASNATGTSGPTGDVTVTTPTPPPPPTVSIGKGAGVNKTDCNTSGCAWVNIDVSNFTPNQGLTIQCQSNYGGVYYTWSSGNDRFAKTDGNGHYSAAPTDSGGYGCYFGIYGKNVSVVVNGVTSNTITW